MSAAPIDQWKYSPDPTIERIWLAREALEAEANGHVRRLFEIAARKAAEATTPDEDEAGARSSEPRSRT